jgi:hypothetical protein
MQRPYDVNVFLFGILIKDTSDFNMYLCFLYAIQLYFCNELIIVQFFCLLYVVASVDYQLIDTICCSKYSKRVPEVLCFQRSNLCIFVNRSQFSGLLVMTVNGILSLG